MAKQLASVRIEDGTVHTRTVGSNTFRYQEGLLSAAVGETLLVQVSVDRDAVPLAPGRYFVSGGSFAKDEYGRIKMKQYGLELMTESELRTSLTGKAS